MNVLKQKKIWLYIKIKLALYYFLKIKNKNIKYHCNKKIIEKIYVLNSTVTMYFDYFK